MCSDIYIIHIRPASRRNGGDYVWDDELYTSTNVINNNNTHGLRTKTKQTKCFTSRYKIAHKNNFSL